MTDIENGRLSLEDGIVARKKAKNRPEKNDDNNNQEEKKKGKSRQNEVEFIKEVTKNEPNPINFS